MVNDQTSTSAAPSTYPDVTLTVGRLPTAQLSSAPTRAAPQRTITPAPTVTTRPRSYTIQPGDTFDSLAERFNLSLEALRLANEGVTTLIPGEMLNIPSAAVLPLEAPAPSCYENRPGSLLCLGRVDNPLDFPVENVSVEVSLLADDGSVYQREQAVVEQMSIPAGSFAPYRAAFEVEADAFSAVAASVSGAERDRNEHAVLLLEDVQGELLDGRVVVSAIVYNPGTQDAEILRVFVTVLDGEGRVIGYRVLTFETETILDAGANFPLRIELTPQVSDAAPQYALYVEARYVP